MDIASIRLIMNLATAAVLVYTVYKIPPNGYVVVGIKSAFLAIALQKVASSALFFYSTIFGVHEYFRSYYALFDFIEIPPVLFLALTLSGFVGHVRLKLGIDKDEFHQRPEEKEDHE